MTRLNHRSLLRAKYPLRTPITISRLVLRAGGIFTFTVNLSKRPSKRMASGTNQCQRLMEEHALTVYGLVARQRPAISPASSNMYPYSDTAQQPSDLCSGTSRSHARAEQPY